MINPPKFKIDLTNPLSISGGVITFLLVIVMTLCGSWAKDINTKTTDNTNTIVQLQTNIAASSVEIENLRTEVGELRADEKDANAKLDILIGRSKR